MKLLKPEEAVEVNGGNRPTPQDIAPYDVSPWDLPSVVPAPTDPNVF